jgi:peptidoglycan hydrolase CwlO-like protein
MKISDQVRKMIGSNFLTRDSALNETLVDIDVNNNELTKLDCERQKLLLKLDSPLSQFEKSLIYKLIEEKMKRMEETLDENEKLIKSVPQYDERIVCRQRKLQACRVMFTGMLEETEKARTSVETPTHKTHGGWSKLFK